MLTFKRFLFNENTSTTPLEAYAIAERNPKKRDRALEEIISKDAQCSYDYAKFVIHQRFRLGENAIKDHLYYAYEYVKYILMTRWPEAEDTIRRVRANWIEYARFLQVKFLYNNVQKFQWLIKTKINRNVIDILNIIGWTREMQEYVIENRPDLIGEIKSLDPYLKDKYEDEFNLSKVDI